MARGAILQTSKNYEVHRKCESEQNSELSSNKDRTELKLCKRALIYSSNVAEFYIYNS